MRAAIYTRISQDDEGIGAGVARQLADCTSLCLARGWTVSPHHVYEDNDFSASTGRHRPGYERLLTAISAHHVDTVVTYHLDRLTRRPLELEQFLDACQLANISHVATVTGDFDLGSDDARFTARILGAVARKEADATSRRVKRKRLEMAEAGLAVGGNRPFGYQRGGMTLDDVEAKEIRAATDHLLDGGSITSVLNDWRARVPTAKGGRWELRTLRAILTSGRIAGLVEVDIRDPARRRTIGPARWPAIITLDELDMLRSRLWSRRRQRSPRTYLLSGLVRCGVCGGKLEGHASNTRRYRCSNAQRQGCYLGVDARGVEVEVMGRVSVVLGSPEYAVACAQVAEAEPARAELLDAEERLERVTERYAAGGLTEREWKVAREVLVERITQAQQELNRAHLTTHTHSAELDWGLLDFPARRVVIEDLVEQVTIAPFTRGGVLGQRVEVKWRF